jgi:hypothetical protein
MRWSEKADDRQAPRRPVRRLGIGALATAIATAALIAPTVAGAATQTFTTPGSASFVVPNDVHSISVEVFGAAGGASGDGKAGGLGAEAHASTVAVTPGETLTVVIGGRGGNGVNGTPLEVCDWGAGGVNGGGEAGECDGEGAAAGGGGGASEVRRAATALVLAGGGGGAGANGTGGAGGAGGENGVAGTPGAAGGGGGGGGGTASAGGAGGPGQGGGQAGKVGTAHAGGEGGFWSDASGGGGGGGVFGGGGGGGSQNFSGGGGGGGSSTGPAGTVFTTGAQSGNGKVVISYAHTSTLSIEASAGVTLGESVGAKATLGSYGQEGTVEFRLFGPEDESCTGSPAFAESMSVTGSGTYEAGFTPTVAGTYSWVATYSGDAEDVGAETACGEATVEVAEPEAPPVEPEPTPEPEPTRPNSTPTAPSATPTTAPTATPVVPAPAVSAPVSPSVRILHSPMTPHRPNRAGGPRYTFTFTGGEAGTTYYCSIDKSHFTACGAKVVYRDLARGRHVFKVKAISAEGLESTTEKTTFKVIAGH